LAGAGKLEDAVAGYLEAAGESPDSALCLKLARAHEKLGNRAEALRWALAVVDSGDDFTRWQAAAAVARRTEEAGEPARRSARVAVLGSYTTTQFVNALWLAARRVGLSLELHESPYAQYRQQIIDPGSAMYEFAPDIVVLAVHGGELDLPAFSSSPEADADAEAERWTSLWQTVGDRTNATVIQHLFAIPPSAPFGHFGATLPGTRAAMSAAVNARLARSAPDHVAVVDCERLAALVGKRDWFDDRYWHLSKQAVSLGAVPLLARHTAAVVAARLGLGKKCLVVDLDNTLWGGIVGEDGLSGIRLGDTPDGEAFQSFQEAILDLKERGIVVAVCSKNNDEDAREVFEHHPGMRIGIDDVAAFIADWRSKPEQIRSVAAGLDLGLDSLVFVDDNPVEREAIRQMVPDVDVITMPRDPADYARALDAYLLFEPASFTSEDARRTDQYRARRAAAAVAESAETIEDFYRSLDMSCVVSPFTDDDLPRIAQLVGKTNQFNLTTRRHSAAALREFMTDPNCVHLSFRLSDRFADQGLVAVAIAFQSGTILTIDTWLMSCRVIGRSLEQTVLQELCRGAAARGCTEMRGSYIPTPKNGLVSDLFERLGFERVADDAESSEWAYDLAAKPQVVNEFIEVERKDPVIHAPA
jgi:FkbH-like protein